MAVRVRCPYPTKTGVPKIRVEPRSKLLSDYRRSLLSPTRPIALDHLRKVFVNASDREARESLETSRRRYNEVRPHWALVPEGGGDVLTPADVYVHRHAVELPKWQGWATAARKLKQLVQGAPLPEATAQALEAAA